MFLVCVLVSLKVEIACLPAATEARDDGGEQDSVSLLSDFTEKEDSNPVLANYLLTRVIHESCTRVRIAV